MVRAISRGGGRSTAPGQRLSRRARSAAFRASGSDNATTPSPFHAIPQRPIAHSNRAKPGAFIALLVLPDARGRNLENLAQRDSRRGTPAGAASLTSNGEALHLDLVQVVDSKPEFAGVSHIARLAARTFQIGHVALLALVVD